MRKALSFPSKSYTHDIGRRRRLLRKPTFARCDERGLFGEGLWHRGFLVPLIQALSPEEDEIIERNIGGFGTELQPLFDGVGAVCEALAKFVVVSGVYCELLTMQVLCGMSQSPHVPAGMTTSPNVVNVVEVPSPTPPDGTSAPTMIVGGNEAPPVSCGSVLDSGLPGKILMDDPPPALYSGLYQPNSNVDHIVKMTEKLELLATSTDIPVGLSAYTDVGSDGISLHCPSVGAQTDYTLRTNPLFVIYMYGLWRSELGSSDPNGYSNKIFDNNDVLYYGDTIVMDEFNKASGYDAMFTVKVIQVMNMWMSMITKMHRAARLCRDGNFDMDLNPVDIAAALWFGSAQNADTPEGGGLYAWAKRAGMKFIEQKIAVTDEVSSQLTLLPTSFSDCKIFDSEEDFLKKGIEMMHMVDYRRPPSPRRRRRAHHTVQVSLVGTDDPGNGIPARAQTQAPRNVIRVVFNLNAELRDFTQRVEQRQWSPYHFVGNFSWQGCSDGNYCNNGRGSSGDGIYP